MSDFTKIEWTDYTDNLWWGCNRVHEGCDNCYAEFLSDDRKRGRQSETYSRRFTYKRISKGI